MSITTKSPKQIAAAAYRIACDTLPEHFSRFSPKKFTQPQLMVCLVMKTFFNTDYRAIVQILNDCPDLCRVFKLKTVPHFTTLQQASKRLLNTNISQKLMKNCIKSVMPKTKTVTLAAIDATGIENGHISPYFFKTRSKNHKYRTNTRITKWPKMAVISDTSNHIILAIYPTRGPGRDSAHFQHLLGLIPQNINIKHVVADAGYDNEVNHVYAREKLNIKTTIPAEGGRKTTNLPKTKYRRQMKLKFDKKSYGQRWQVETVFSMIKRNLGDSIAGKNYRSQCRDIRLLVLTHNLMILLLVKELFYRAEI